MFLERVRKNKDVIKVCEDKDIQEIIAFLNVLVGPAHWLNRKKLPDTHSSQMVY